MIHRSHLNNSRSQRVLCCSRNLGIEYEIKRYQRDQKTMLAPPELRQVIRLASVTGDPDRRSDPRRVRCDHRIFSLSATATDALVPAPAHPRNCATNIAALRRRLDTPMLLMKLISIDREGADAFLRPPDRAKRF